MNALVTISRQGPIAVVLLDNPPVNALSAALRNEMAAAFETVRDDPGITGVVLACAGRTFVAGADITEFGKPPQRPSLPDLIIMLETFKKPVVAAIHGTALGGGLELALGCHFRVCTADAKMGLPEVKLGLLPGAGGTIRLPRLIGVSDALGIIMSGEPVRAAKAKSLGLVEAVVEGDLVASAVAFISDKIASGAPFTSLRDRDDKIAGAKADLAAFDRDVVERLKKSKGLEAPVVCARSVRNGLTMDFDEAVNTERKYFFELIDGDQSKAQRHLFFAERSATKVEGVDKNVTPRIIASVGIIGAGTMGGGIAMSFLNAGLPVTILDMTQEALDRGTGVIGKNYGISVQRGSMTEEAKVERLARLKSTTDYNELAGCDLIVEAAFEELAIKQKIFSQLDAIAKPGAILATNTSYLDVNAIAGFTKRPESVLGLHFFSPANVMKLVEIVRGAKTALDVLATGLAVARRIGKIPVVVGVCHGFVGNRMLAARSIELEDLLLEGVLPETIDKVFTDFGWPMGPFAMRDLAGLDIGWRNRKSLGQTAPITDALCEQGRYGQKTSKGYYLYEAGSRTPKPDPEVAKLIAEHARKSGVAARNVTADEIIERTLYPMINEGAKILEEGIAARSSDIDIVFVNGYGFPVGKGGPMFWADKAGWPKIVERLKFWHDKTGKDGFSPAKSLTEKAPA